MPLTSRIISSLLINDPDGPKGDMDEILRIAQQYNLKIIEDAAHALPSEYKKRRIG